MSSTLKKILRSTYIDPATAQEDRYYIEYDAIVRGHESLWMRDGKIVGAGNPESVELGSNRRPQFAIGIVSHPNSRFLGTMARIYLTAARILHDKWYSGDEAFARDVMEALDHTPFESTGVAYVSTTLDKDGINGRAVFRGKTWGDFFRFVDSGYYCGRMVFTQKPHSDCTIVSFETAR